MGESTSGAQDKKHSIMKPSGGGGKKRGGGGGEVMGGMGKCEKYLLPWRMTYLRALL